MIYVNSVLDRRVFNIKHLKFKSNTYRRTADRVVFSREVHRQGIKKYMNSQSNQIGGRGGGGGGGLEIQEENLATGNRII